MDGMFQAYRNEKGQLVDKDGARFFQDRQGRWWRATQANREVTFERVEMVSLSPWVEA